MVIDATVPSLVLLVVLVVAVVGLQGGATVLTWMRLVAHRSAGRRLLAGSERWCPRVVLIDVDDPALVAA